MKALTKILTLVSLSIVMSTASACGRYKGAEAVGKNKCSVPEGRYIVNGLLGDSDRYTATLWVTGCKVNMVIEDSQKQKNTGDYLILRNRPNRDGRPPEGMDHPPRPPRHKKGHGHHGHKGHGHHRPDHHRGHGRHGGAKLCRGNSINFGIGKDRIAIANPSDLIGEVRLEYIENEKVLRGSIQLGEEHTILHDTTVDLYKQ